MAKKVTFIRTTSSKYKLLLLHNAQNEITNFRNLKRKLKKTLNPKLWISMPYVLRLQGYLQVQKEVESQHDSTKKTGIRPHPKCRGNAAWAAEPRFRGQSVSAGHALSRVASSGPSIWDYPSESCILTLYFEFSR